MSLLSGIIASTLPPVTSLQLGSATGNGSWINGAPTVSTSGAAGDLLISIQMKRNYSPTAITTPSGFTNFIQTNGNYYSINASYKVTTASSETITFQNLNDTSAVILRARPNGRIQTVTSNNITVDESSNAGESSTLALSTATYPVFAVALGFGSNNTKNIGTNPNLNNGIYFDASNFQNLVYYQVYNTSPGNVSCNVAADGETFIASFYLTVA
jgi:hypothetical protein